MKLRHNQKSILPESLNGKCKETDEYSLDMEIEKLEN